MQERVLRRLEEQEAEAALSPSELERIRSERSQALQEITGELSRQAQANGLTDEKLEEILNEIHDESSR